MVLFCCYTGLRYSDVAALHAGNLPGYPASHGCIRLPPAMAKALYGMTKIGDSVEIEA